VENADLDAIQPTAEVARLGRPDAVSVQFRGVCAACQSKEATTA
jgi:Fe-S cluster biogenesis protein NfuA